VLDPRLRTKMYGQQFLKSLPCRLRGMRCIGCSSYNLSIDSYLNSQINDWMNGTTIRA
jgi:hypothetical protein